MNESFSKNVIHKKLAKKVIVITGASSGVGRATALECARHGAHLVLVARREAALAELVRECESLGAKAMAQVTDVTDAAAVKILAEKTIAFGDRIDVWVNNAGVLAAGSFDATPVEIHDQVIGINLLGYLHGTHAAMPIFKKQGHGILINNISVGGWFPTPYAAGYSASKFGLRGFSEALRGELYAWPHIHVCDLFPAFLDTPGMQHAANYTGRYVKPAPPVYDPQRVAEAIVSLALRPRNAETIGFAATFLKMAHFLFPSLSRRITATLIESYLKTAKPLPITPGNLFEPAAFGTSIYGGWQKKFQPQKKKLARTFLFAGLAIGYLLMRNRANN